MGRAPLPPLRALARCDPAERGLRRAAEMVAPIQYSLSQFLSNAISLVGGVAMCFLTSWRLSSTPMGLEPQTRSG